MQVGATMAFVEGMDTYAISGYNTGTNTGTVSGSLTGFNVQTKAATEWVGTSAQTTFFTGASASKVSYTFVGVTTYTVGGTTYQGMVGETSGGSYFLFVPSGQTAPTAGSITVTPDNTGSTLTDQATHWDLTTHTIGCFVAGTRIATPDGAVAVESLAAGDLVLTADGRAVPVRWLGRTVVSRAFADPLQVLPVRIRAGALAENVPSRDLLVSPSHAIRVGDVLAQAAALVNGTSVVREQDVLPVFSYYHLELDTHALVLAEGAPAESYLEGVEDIGFMNFAERIAPESVVEMAYPRVRAQRQLPAAVREHLAARAALFAPVAKAA